MVHIAVPVAGPAAATGGSGPGSRARTRLYRDGICVLHDFPVADISEHLIDPRSVVWLDLCRPTAGDFVMINEKFGLHELAVEDAVGESQRPKLDRYASHLFLSAYAVSFDTGDTALAVSEIAVFITDQALITVRKNDHLDLTPVLARWDSSDDLAGHGVGFLLYGLLDHLVDGQFTAVQRLDECVQELEDLLFDERHAHVQAVQRRSFQLRKSLVALRRVVLPMREVLNTLMRRDLSTVDAAMAPYYQDVYDHVLRATEWVESLRDLVASTVETSLAVQANRMNLIMKKVTSWAAIIAVPTAITGFYGQNLPYPGFGSHWGVLVSTALIGALSALLYLAFRRKDWL
ncbi:magnesium transporter CorA family protein [Dactylosporangium matsuzakiense]|uniref:Magnesium transporter CorA n=1 Tax=Dactylosporangium matsuzakiense TaxID=53360 RepID=A0A9W6KM26_9ACTN|nr:magnesium transporter CorA family protein [Dactylosporangium matsuzakiense]UWZ50125.1 magnesium transporter CorA family protein [Dactylosporangium matsuzakiense]GLL03390.1 magnesium transporter CorA [Dactylosporangium matsuzakiense]